MSKKAAEKRRARKTALLSQERERLQRPLRFTVNISAKLRLTAWFALQMFLMAALVLVFVFVVKGADVTDDPAQRLTKIVTRNSRDIEVEHGQWDFSDVDVCRRGVYTQIYTGDGEQLYGAAPESFSTDAPFEPYVIRSVTSGGEVYLLYDELCDLGFIRLWTRGIIAENDDSGLMHTILILTLTVLPALLVISIGGGWLVATHVFKPVEKITAIANSIGESGDLSGRINLRRGPSELKRLSAAFDAMFERLERSFNAERQFSSDASHELRTPITVILAACDRSRRKDGTREQFLETLTLVEEQAHGMSELVSSLLGLTRLQQGTERYPLQPGDLSAFAEACCGEFVPADARGITLETDIAPGVAARYNASLMSRVLHNLLQNAYKYGRDGGHIRLSLRAENGRAVLRVRDDGIGIAPEDIERIWQRFWQADSSRGEDSGTGLGLAMVKEMVEFQGGAVGVESAPGVGSTFTVTL